MAAACVYIRGAQCTSVGLLTVDMQLTTEGSPGNPYDHAVEVAITTSAQQLRTQVINAAKAKLAEVGHPVVGNETVVVFGGND